MTKEKISFAIENFEMMDDNPDSQFATARAQAFASGPNYHRKICDSDTLKRTASTLFSKPVLYSINRQFQDFMSHSNNPEDTRIAGFVQPNSASFEELPDHRTAFNCVLKIWKYYAPTFMKIFSRDSGNKKTSVEMLLLEGEDNPDGSTQMKNFEYLGICVLGDNIKEGSPGSNMQMLSFAQEQQEFQNALKTEFSNYDGVDFIYPEKVKSNVEKGLQLHKLHNKGGNSVSLAVAHHISKNDKSTPEKVRSIAKAHKSSKYQNMQRNPPSNEYISYMLYGGKESAEWSNEISGKLDELDKQHLSYFSDLVTFPYTSREDMNPSLRGIEPPVSLEQGNSIALQADSIGGDYGWPTAIKSFKDRHIAKDGKWVLKENQNNSVEETAFTDDNLDNKGRKENINMKDDKNMMVDNKEAEKKEEEKENPKEEKVETPKEEAKEEKKEDVKGEKKENMSLDGNVDVAAILAILEDETDEYKSLVEESKIEGFSATKFVTPMYAKYCKMSADYKEMSGKFAKSDEDNKAYMSELEGLRKFKADIEAEKFNFEVDSTIKEVENSVDMPKDDLTALREDAKNFSLSTVDAWKNSVKAKAFTFAIKSKKNDDGIKRYGLNYINLETTKNTNSPW